MKGSSVAARAAWGLAATAGVVLICLGLGQTFYIGTVTNAFERDRLGSTSILAGSVLGLAAAGWSLYRRDQLWVSLLVAAPAVVVGGLNLVAGGSLLPHIGALAAVPLGLAGIIGGVTVGSGRIRS
ncbi:hypothetical protein [Pseudarthrobacter sp. PvP090]|uniref:hypothetical protein n=1 Tax=Pseudarthrobacter sp. PvP090 TaxID=3156393 RepID=UPI0033992160